MESEIEIQKKVIDELKWESALNAIKPAEIGVSVRNEVVTLTGIVDNYAMSLIAEKAALRVKGVKAVANELKVVLAQEKRVDDSHLAETILTVMQWNTLIPEERIKVSVKDGWVTLEGEVEWYFQRRAAEQAVEAINGVKGVDNHILLVPKQATSSDLKQRIRDAFERQGFVSGKDVEIDIDGKTATLRVKVRTLPEKKAAENAVWSAPGINRVDNRLEVSYTEFIAHHY
jgi:osmotically-inducible protein OsmY